MYRYSGPLLAAVLILSFAGPADAQGYMSFGFGAPSSRQTPEVNLYLSARYDWLLRTSPRFRAYRMWNQHSAVARRLHRFVRSVRAGALQITAD
jgi:hypothetical protein